MCTIHFLSSQQQAAYGLTNLLLLLPLLDLSSCSFSPRPLRNEEALPVRTHSAIGVGVADEEGDGEYEKVGIRQSYYVL